MAESCTVFEIKRDIGGKTPIPTPLYLTCTIPQNYFEFLPKILIQTLRVPKPLGGGKIVPDTSRLCRGCNELRDRRTARVAFG